MANAIRKFVICIAFIKIVILKSELRGSFAYKSVKKKKKCNAVEARLVQVENIIGGSVYCLVEEVAGEHRGHGKRSAVRCLVFSRP